MNTQPGCHQDPRIYNSRPSRPQGIRHPVPYPWNNLWWRHCCPLPRVRSIGRAEMTWLLVCYSLRSLGSLWLLVVLCPLLWLCEWNMEGWMNGLACAARQYLGAVYLLVITVHWPYVIACRVWTACDYWWCGIRYWNCANMEGWMEAFKACAAILRCGISLGHYSTLALFYRLPCLGSLWLLWFIAW